MTLEYNETTERYNDLHCGESLKIKLSDKWVNVRIELSGTCKKENWYFVDENGFTKRCHTLEGCEISQD